MPFSSGYCQDQNAVSVPGSTLEEATSDKSSQLAHYNSDIKPLLTRYCYDCHGNGSKEGGLQLDAFESDDALLADHGRWTKVLKNVRAGVMPPSDAERPSEVEVQTLANWIKVAPFGIDPTNVDPGRVTIHRLNRIEYRYTIDQLLGVVYNTDDEFPPDAAGLGLDNIADLLTTSPLILEKYFDAAESVLDGAFPSEIGREFIVLGDAIRGNNNSTGERLSFSGSPEVTFTYRNANPGSFRISIELEVAGGEVAESGSEEPKGNATDEKATASPGESKCHLVATLRSGVSDEKILIDQDFTGESKKVEFAFDKLWKVEPQKFNFVVTASGAGAGERRGFGEGRGGRGGGPSGPLLKITNIRITAQQTAASKRFFGRDVPPENLDELRQYVRHGIFEFGLRAFRRPIDNSTLDRLVSDFEAAYQKSSRFNDSLKPSLAKILCSPRFLFRIDRPVPGTSNTPWSLIDEYSLASRLSYFLWSGMPDDELLELARKGELRKNLDAQVKRMLAHDFSYSLIENFSGQWLQTRNVENWPVVESAVLQREGIQSTNQKLTDYIRWAMEQETTIYFARIVGEDRSILEVIDSDYTFLTQDLAEYYGIPGVKGDDFKLVTLPADSPRGGVLTQGSTLLVTSNANRTSPVKRGVFVLDNILGMRPHDPPADVPSIDKAIEGIKDREPTLRESLELHRKDTLCASCHNLMDPIGFGLDSFNAIGQYRETEFGQPINASGKLASGEEFNGIRELKQILKTTRRKDFYRCLTEKLMTYALGRGMEYYDTESVDLIVQRLENENGKFSALLMGIIESAPFQKRRNITAADTTVSDGSESTSDSSR